PVEALAEIVRVDHLLRRLARQLCGAPLDHLQTREQLLCSRQCGRGALRCAGSEPLQRSDHLAHTLAWNVAQSILHGTRAIGETVEVTTKRDGEAAHEAIEPFAQSFFDRAEHRPDLLLHSAPC